MAWNRFSMHLKISARGKLHIIVRVNKNTLRGNIYLEKGRGKGKLTHREKTKTKERGRKRERKKQSHLCSPFEGRITNTIVIILRTNHRHELLIFNFLSLSFLFLFFVFQIQLFFVSSLLVSTLRLFLFSSSSLSSLFPFLAYGEKFFSTQKPQIFFFFFFQPSAPPPYHFVSTLTYHFESTSVTSTSLILPLSLFYLRFLPPKKTPSNTEKEKEKEKKGGFWTFTLPHLCT